MVRFFKLLKKKLFIGFIILISFNLTGTVIAAQCFIAKEQDKILIQEGDCHIRYTPQSTFKIALSLMGYNENIFKNTNDPIWPFEKKYAESGFITNVCKNAHDPASWMRDSCVWYSQLLTQQLGIEKFENYVTIFNYGNQDLSGEKGKNNGLTHAWLTSSLEISPVEQIAFLQKLVTNTLPVNQKSQELTKQILYREELRDGWKLYGKTGTGRLLNKDKSKKLDVYHGWFVGWIEKKGRKIVFASHIADDSKQETIPSFRAKCTTENKLFKLIEKFSDEN